MTAPAVAFRHVDIVFGDRARDALALLDTGATRAEILEKTGAVLGAADANLDVGEGEITVLMGLSGSGKSTLLRAINGLNRPLRGEVLVKDENGVVDVASCDAEALRRIRMGRVAMVFQSFALLPWRTVEQNVGFGLELAGVPEAEKKQRVARQLALVGLDKWGGKYAHELSGGMQQRVGLARAFATEAPILLMDEPFSALDPLIRTHLQDELLQLQKQLKRTIVFVSHDLDEALKLGTRIAIMEGGRIVQYGPPQTIVLEPANEYVAEFVQHMNPLNVLDGATMMRKVEELKTQAGALVIDEERGVTLSLDPQGGPSSAAVGPRIVGLLPADAADDALLPGRLAVVRQAMSMRHIIDARMRTGLPVVLVNEGRVTGVVGDHEIYAGLITRPSRKQ